MTGEFVDDFVVTRRTTCPVCKGIKVVQHPAWADFFQEYPGGYIPGVEEADQRVALLDWFAVRGYEPPPMRNADCQECDGVGVVFSNVSLAAALEEIGIVARLERLEGPKISRLPLPLDEYSFEDEHAQ